MSSEIELEAIKLSKRENVISEAVMMFLNANKELREKVAVKLYREGKPCLRDFWIELQGDEDVCLRRVFQ